MGTFIDYGASTGWVDYHGTDLPDRIDTAELQRQRPRAGLINVYGFGGDDIIYTSFIGREGYDIIEGGDGNDTITVFPAFQSPGFSSSANIQGNSGTDIVNISPQNIKSISDFEVNDEIINFTIKSPTGYETDVEVWPDVEIIKLDGKRYLTEDIIKGRIRAVKKDEIEFRTTGKNADWWLNDLNTYKDYKKRGKSKGKNEDDKVTDKDTERLMDPLGSNGSNTFMNGNEDNELATFLGLSDVSQVNNI